MYVESLFFIGKIFANEIKLFSLTTNELFMFFRANIP